MSMLWSGHIDRGDKLDAYPFRVPGARRRYATQLSAEELERSSADFRRMLAKPQGPEFWTPERSAKVKP